MQCSEIPLTFPPGTNQGFGCNTICLLFLISISRSCAIVFPVLWETNKLKYLFHLVRLLLAPQSPEPAGQTWKKAFCTSQTEFLILNGENKELLLGSQLHLLADEKVTQTWQLHLLGCCLMPARESLSHFRVTGLTWLAASAWCSRATGVAKCDAASQSLCDTCFALSVLGCQLSWDSGALGERRKTMKHLYKLAEKSFGFEFCLSSQGLLLR